MSSNAIILTLLAVIAVIGLERIFRGLERSSASLSKAEQDSLCVLYTAYLREAEQAARMMPLATRSGSTREEQEAYGRQRRREEEAYRAFQEGARQLRERKAVESSGREWQIGSYEKPEADLGRRVYRRVG